MEATIVPPIALEKPKTIEATIPENAAGITTFMVTSSLVEPSANAPSQMAFGTAERAFSDREAIVGVIMIPITIPELKALKISKEGIIFCKIGVKNVKAKKP